jgi:protein SCO1/2
MKNSRLPFALFLILASAVFVYAQKNTGTATANGPSAAQKYFGDTELLDQDGNKFRFYSDLLKGHTVVINVFFSTCTSVCPPMTRTLARVQQLLGDRVGRDIVMLSISVDPTTDTPERLKQYATRFHAAPGWHFLTGTSENVTAALKKLGQYVSDKNDHSTVLFIGNEPTGLWKKAYALSKPEELAKIVEAVSTDTP